MNAKKTLRSDRQLNSTKDSETINSLEGIIVSDVSSNKAKNPVKDDIGKIQNNNKITQKVASSEEAKIHDNMEEGYSDRKLRRSGKAGRNSGGQLEETTIKQDFSSSGDNAQCLVRQRKRRLAPDECQRTLRRLELDAYSSLVSAFRAQGDLTEDKKKMLTSLQSLLNVSQERHKAEIRRSINDETLSAVSECVTDGAQAVSNWQMEGRRLIPLLSRNLPPSFLGLAADRHVAVASRLAASSTAVSNTLTSTTALQPAVTVGSEAISSASTVILNSTSEAVARNHDQNNDSDDNNDNCVKNNNNGGSNGNRISGNTGHNGGSSDRTNKTGNNNTNNSNKGSTRNKSAVINTDGAVFAGTGILSSRRSSTTGSVEEGCSRESTNDSRQSSIDFSGVIAPPSLGFLPTMIDDIAVEDLDSWNPSLIPSSLTEHLILNLASCSGNLYHHSNSIATVATGNQSSTILSAGFASSLLTKQNVTQFSSAGKTVGPSITLHTSSTPVQKESVNQNPGPAHQPIVLSRLISDLSRQPIGNTNIPINTALLADGGPYFNPFEIDPRVIGSQNNAFGNSLVNSVGNPLANAVGNPLLASVLNSLPLLNSAKMEIGQAGNLDVEALGYRVASKDSSSSIGNKRITLNDSVSAAKGPVGAVSWPGKGEKSSMECFDVPSVSGNSARKVISMSGTGLGSSQPGPTVSGAPTMLASSNPLAPPPPRASNFVSQGAGATVKPGNLDQIDDGVAFPPSVMNLLFNDPSKLIREINSAGGLQKNDIDIDRLINDTMISKLIAPSSQDIRPMSLEARLSSTMATNPVRNELNDPGIRSTKLPGTSGLIQKIFRPRVPVIGMPRVCGPAVTPASSGIVPVAISSLPGGNLIAAASVKQQSTAELLAASAGKSFTAAGSMESSGGVGMVPNQAGLVPNVTKSTIVRINPISGSVSRLPMSSFLPVSALVENLIRSKISGNVSEGNTVGPILRGNTPASSIVLQNPGGVLSGIPGVISSSVAPDQVSERKSSLAEVPIPVGPGIVVSRITGGVTSGPPRVPFSQQIQFSINSLAASSLSVLSKPATLPIKILSESKPVQPLGVAKIPVAVTVGTGNALEAVLTKSEPNLIEIRSGKFVSKSESSLNIERLISSKNIAVNSMTSQINKTVAELIPSALVSLAGVNSGGVGQGGGKGSNVIEENVQALSKESSLSRSSSGVSHKGSSNENSMPGKDPVSVKSGIIHLATPAGGLGDVSQQNQIADGSESGVADMKVSTHDIGTGKTRQQLDAVGRDNRLGEGDLVQGGVIKKMENDEESGARKRVVLIHGKVPAKSSTVKTVEPPLGVASVSSQFGPFQKELLNFIQNRDSNQLNHQPLRMTHSAGVTSESRSSEADFHSPPKKAARLKAEPWPVAEPGQGLAVSLIGQSCDGENLAGSLIGCSSDDKSLAGSLIGYSNDSNNISCGSVKSEIESSANTALHNSATTSVTQLIECCVAAEKQSDDILLENSATDTEILLGRENAFMKTNKGFEDRRHQQDAIIEIAGANSIGEFVGSGQSADAAVDSHDESEYEIDLRDNHLSKGKQLDGSVDTVIIEEKYHKNADRMFENQALGVLVACEDVTPPDEVSVKTEKVSEVSRTGDLMCENECIKTEPVKQLVKTQAVIGGSSDIESQTAKDMITNVLQVEESHSDMLILSVRKETGSDIHIKAEGFSPGKSRKDESFLSGDRKRKADSYEIGETVEKSCKIELESSNSIIDEQNTCVTDKNTDCIDKNTQIKKDISTLNAQSATDSQEGVSQPKKVVILKAAPKTSSLKTTLSGNIVRSTDGTFDCVTHSNLVTSTASSAPNNPFSGISSVSDVYSREWQASSGELENNFLTPSEAIKAYYARKRSARNAASRSLREQQLHCAGLSANSEIVVRYASLESEEWQGSVVLPNLDDDIKINNFGQDLMQTNLEQETVLPNLSQAIVQENQCQEIPQPDRNQDVILENLGEDLKLSNKSKEICEAVDTVGCSDSETDEGNFYCLTKSIDMCNANLGESFVESLESEEGLNPEVETDAGDVNTNSSGDKIVDSEIFNPVESSCYKNESKSVCEIDTGQVSQEDINIKSKESTLEKPVKPGSNVDTEHKMAESETESYGLNAEEFELNLVKCSDIEIGLKDGQSEDDLKGSGVLLDESQDITETNDDFNVIKSSSMDKERVEKSSVVGHANKEKHGSNDGSDNIQNDLKNSDLLLNSESNTANIESLENLTSNTTCNNKLGLSLALRENETVEKVPGHSIIRSTSLQNPETDMLMSSPKPAKSKKLMGPKSFLLRHNLLDEKCCYSSDGSVSDSGSDSPRRSSRRSLNLSPCSSKSYPFSSPNSRYSSPKNKSRIGSSPLALKCLVESQIPSKSLSVCINRITFDSEMRCDKARMSKSNINENSGIFSRRKSPRKVLWPSSEGSKKSPEESINSVADKKVHLEEKQKILAESSEHETVLDTKDEPGAEQDNNSVEASMLEVASMDKLSHCDKIEKTDILSSNNTSEDPSCSSNNDNKRFKEQKSSVENIWDHIERSYPNRLGRTDMHVKLADGDNTTAPVSSQCPSDKPSQAIESFDALTKPVSLEKLREGIVVSKEIAENTQQYGDESSKNIPVDLDGKKENESSGLILVKSLSGEVEYSIDTVKDTVIDSPISTSDVVEKMQQTEESDSTVSPVVNESCDVNASELGRIKELNDDLKTSDLTEVKDLGSVEAVASDSLGYKKNERTLSDVDITSQINESLPRKDLELKSDDTASESESKTDMTVLENESNFTNSDSIIKKLSGNGPENTIIEGVDLVSPENDNRKDCVLNFTGESADDVAEKNSDIVQTITTSEEKNVVAESSMTSGSDVEKEGGKVSQRVGQRKRRPPTTPISSPERKTSTSSSPGASWIRQALGLLGRVCRFRSTGRERNKPGEAEWFLYPVDAEEVLDYYDIVKNPMDFSTVRKKLEGGLYSDWSMFHSDILLISSNCELYNKIGSDARTDGEVVFKYYQDEILKIVPKSQLQGDVSDGTLKVEGRTTKRSRLDHSGSSSGSTDRTNR